MGGGEARAEEKTRGWQHGRRGRRWQWSGGGEDESLAGRVLGE